MSDLEAAEASADLPLGGDLIIQGGTSEHGDRDFNLDLEIGDGDHSPYEPSSWSVIADSTPRETAIHSKDTVDGAVFESRMRTIKRPIPTMPWEKGPMKFVFGSWTLGVNVEIEQPVEMATLPSSSSAPAVEIHEKCPAYLSSVRFRAGLKCAAGDTRDRSLRRWRAIILNNPDASALGAELCSLADEGQQLEAIEEALLGKSNGTINKRSLSVQRFMAFCNDALDIGVCFPFEEKTMYLYYRHLHKSEKHSALKDFAETVNFCVHVLGIECRGDLRDPRIGGLIRDGRLHRKALKQSRVLTVAEVLSLERFVVEKKGHLFDLLAAGTFLFMLYSRARCSDIRHLDATRVDEGPSGSRCGYVEVETNDHKNSRVTRKIGIPLTLVAPLYGIHAQSWGLSYVETALSAGIELKGGHSGPLLPGIDAAGSLVSRPLSSAEMSTWLNKILAMTLGTVEPGLTSHGLKSTPLSWCSKVGLSEEDRHILGHHSMTGKRSLVVYARDTQSAPIRRFEGVISDIRHGNFFPDSTRSGMVRKGAPLSEKAGEVPVEVKSDAGSPVVVDLEDGAPADGSASAQPVTPAGGETPSSSSSSSSSSEYENCALDDVTEKMVSAAVPEAAIAGVCWKSECDLYRHNKTYTLHARAKGSDLPSFICGRKITSEFSRFTGTIHSNAARCKQCDRGKSLRDPDAVAAYMDSLKARRLSR